MTRKEQVIYFLNQCESHAVNFQGQTHLFYFPLGQIQHHLLQNYFGVLFEQQKYFLWDFSTIVQWGQHSEAHMATGSVTLCKEWDYSTKHVWTEGKEIPLI